MPDTNNNMSAAGDYWPWAKWYWPTATTSYPTTYTYYTQVDWDKLEGLVRRVVREELEKREKGA